MTVMNKLLKSVLFSLLLGVVSCNENRLYEEFHSFQDTPWAEEDSVFFDLSDVDGIEGQSLIAVKYNENYTYSNCYIRVVERDSSKTVVQSKLLNVPIFDSKSGLPLGEGFGNTYTKYDTIPYQLSKATKEVILIQYMRRPELIGIEAVGLKLLKP
jgi:gliding motility-associated lipoprotein GldH